MQKSAPTAAECRQLATDYNAESRGGGISQRRAAVLKNIARSLSGLASQLEMLDEPAEQGK